MQSAQALVVPFPLKYTLCNTISFSPSLASHIFILCQYTALFFPPPGTSCAVRLHCDLDLVSLDSHNTALVIAVSCGSWPAEHLITVRFQNRSQFVYLFSAPHAESKMDQARPRRRLLRVLHRRTVHDFQPGSSFKGKEIRAEICIFIVIALIGYRAEIFHEKFLCFFQKL